MKVALYARVSTTDQSCEVQLLELRQYCVAKAWTISEEIQDTISGTKSDRSGLNRVMHLVREKQVGAVLAVKIDRMARSMAHFSRLTQEFLAADVAMVLTSQGIDTSKSNPCGRFQVNILAAVAEFERDLISERTKAGLAAARASGKSLGKPSKLLPPLEEQIKILTKWFTENGANDFRGLGKALGGVSGATALRIWRRHEKKILGQALDVS